MNTEIKISLKNNFLLTQEFGFICFFPPSGCGVSSSRPPGVAVVPLPGRGSSAVAHISPRPRGVDSSLLLSLRRRQTFGSSGGGEKKKEKEGRIGPGIHRSEPVRAPGALCEGGIVLFSLSLRSSLWRMST